MARAVASFARILGAVALLVALAPSSKAALAQMPGWVASGGKASEAIEFPEDIAPDAVAGLVAGLTDAQARAGLLEVLSERAEARARGGGDGGLGVALVRFRKGLEALSQRIRGHMQTLQLGYARLPGELPQSLKQIAGDTGWGPLLLHALGFLALGLAGYLAASWATRGRRAMLRAELPRAVLAHVGGAIYRAFLNLLPILAFAALSLGAVTIGYSAGGAERNFVVTVISGVLLVMVVAYLVRFVLAPRAPGLRLLPISDPMAVFLARWLTALAGVAIVLWLAAGLVILAGMTLPSHLTVVTLTGGAMAVGLIAMVLRGSGMLGQAIVGERETLARRRLARLAPYVLIGYVVAVWLHWADGMLMRQATGIWAAAAGIAFLASLPAIDRWCDQALRGLFAVEEARAELVREEAEASRPPEDEPPVAGEATAIAEEGAYSPAIAEASGRVEARERYVQIAQQALRVVVALLVAFFVSSLVGIDLTGLGAQAAQAHLFSILFSLFATFAVSYLLWRLFASFINPHMPGERRSTADDEGAGAPQTRLETLMPLLRTTAKIVLVVFAIMIALANTGINIAPLIAGAGIIGLAIGFGAQKLVQDIVSGIFFLIDDAFRIGEYIEFEDLRGEVEAISLRSLRLRHHRGAVHTVPFSELRTVTNYNRNWVIYKMEFRLPHDVDIEKIRKAIKKLGEELLADPTHGPKLLQPLKSQGIQRMDETAIILRTKFMCLPREQFVLRRVAYQRICDLFAEMGVEFAGRQVMVRTAAGDNAPEPDPEAAGGGAGVAARIGAAPDGALADQR